MVWARRHRTDWDYFAAEAGDDGRSLHGNWRTEHLRALQQALAYFDFHGAQLAECDGALEAKLAAFVPNSRTVRVLCKSDLITFAKLAFASGNEVACLA